jgi:SAM-dependent methyltransferase
MDSSGYKRLAREYYDEFHKTCRNFDAATKAVLTKHADLIPDVGLVLEVGCGRGRCSEFLGTAADRVVQLDATFEMLALRNREPCLLRVHADATSAPLFDAQFEAVVGFLIDPFIGLNLFAECHRLLRQGGVFLATTPAEEWGRALRGASDPNVSTARFITKDKTTVTVPSTLVPRQKIQDMLIHSGFQDVVTWSQPLPTACGPISSDVEAAAERAAVDVFALPLIYLIRAVKP